MHLSTKLALGLTLTSTVILGAHGIRQLRQEERDLRGAAEHDFRLLGTALQVAVEHSVRDRQVADVHAILEALELNDSAVDVLVFDRQLALQANSLGSDASEQKVRPMLAGVQSSSRPDIRFEGPGGLGQLVGVFPLRGESGATAGTMALVWPLDELRRDLRATVRFTITSSLTLIAGIAGVGWLLSLVLVRRPLRALTDAMRLVEAGTWDATVPARAGDEVGAALLQFNAMVRELAEARRKLIGAAEAREQLEAGLLRLDKLATVGQLSAGLAHEIGSPLQILNGRARAIASRDDLPPDVRRSARILGEQSDRIARIVEQLLGFARRSVARMSRVEPRAAVSAIVDLMAVEARRQAVALELNAPADLPRIEADADQVQQVTMNLLSNALRAASPGGRVWVALSAAWLKPDERTPPAPAVELSVEDTGPGIPDDVASRMFEPFFSTWTSSGGTGLGLAVVKAIVDEHGGRIEVAPRPGGGTRFTVLFPLDHQHRTAEAT